MTFTADPTRPVVRRRVWLRLLLGGLALWTAAVTVTFVTGNPNLLPTVVFLGSFLVPVTFVAWAWERRETGELTSGLILTAFTVGGVLGVCAASVLEAYLLDPSPWLFLGVGLIEEAAKLAALAVFTRRLTVRSVRDGMVLGATVGFGFAAFESAGYAFTALFIVDGLSLMQVVETEVLRGLLAPFGHGLWTAILGGVFFASWRAGRFALTGPLVLAYLGVSLLHALWDWTHDIAVVLTRLLTEPRYAPTPYGWLEVPTQSQVNLFTALQWGGWAIISAAGVAWLMTMWRHATDPQKGVSA